MFPVIVISSWYKQLHEGIFISAHCFRGLGLCLLSYVCWGKSIMVVGVCSSFPHLMVDRKQQEGTRES